MDSKHAMGLFIIAIMVLSVFGIALEYAFGGGQNKVKYNGYTFTQTQEGWSTKYNGKTLIFGMPPDSLESMKLPLDAASLKAVAITYNPADEFADVLGGAQYSIQQILLQTTDIYPIIGLINSTGTSQAQIDCQTATASTPIIYLMIANTTEITNENNCVKFSATTPSALSDQMERFIYGALGIIK